MSHQEKQLQAGEKWKTWGRDLYIEYGESCFRINSLLRQYIRGEGGLIPPADLSCCNKQREEKEKLRIEQECENRRRLHPLVDNCVPYRLRIQFDPKTWHLGESEGNKVIDMSFKIKLNPTRSGGTRIRGGAEIVYNNLQGKLAEILVHNENCPSNMQFKPIDYALYDRGKWDDHDIVTVDGKTEISVKSGLPNHNLLLLTSEDHDKNGVYKHHASRNDDAQVLYAYARLGLSKKCILKEIEKGQEHFTRWFLKKYSCIKYDVFYCSLDRVQGAIKNGHIIKKGEKLNGAEPMDATNYYVLTYNMERDINSCMR